MIIGERRNFAGLQLFIMIKAQWFVFFFFFFCLSGNYFETGKGYKLEIWQEGVV